MIPSLFVRRPGLLLWGLLCAGGAYALFVAASLDAPLRLRVADVLVSAACASAGTLGTLWARSLFERGEFQRRVWSALALSNGMLFLDNALRTRWLLPDLGRDPLADPFFFARAVLITLNNVAQAYAFLLIASSYVRARLVKPGEARAVRSWLALAPAFALAAPLMPRFWILLHAGGNGPWLALAEIASTASDLVTLIVFVPLLQGAYRLRGGRLTWVWWAIVLSGSVWFLYDVSEWLVAVLPGGPHLWLPLFEVSRAVGLASMGVAGVLQRLAVLPAEAGEAAQLPRGAT